MTIMWDLVTILDGPCASIELTSLFEPLTLSPNPFVATVFMFVRGLIIGILYLVHPRL